MAYDAIVWAGKRSYRMPPQRKDPAGYVRMLIQPLACVVPIESELHAYDVIVWAEKRSHNILTQRKDPAGYVRMLMQP